MAKRGRKPGSKNKKNNCVNKNIQVVMLIILSILLAVLIYGKTGYIGETLSPILGGIIGWIEFIIPIGMFVIAISLACDKKDFVSVKIFQLLIFLMCISAIFSIYQISENIINLKDDLSDNIKIAYNLGTKNIGGGVLGIMLAIPMVNMLGVAGAVILCIGISLVILVFMLGIPVSEIIENYIYNLKERKEEIREYREKEYEENKQRKIERKRIYWKLEKE